MRSAPSKEAALALAPKMASLLREQMDARVAEEAEGLGKKKKAKKPKAEVDLGPSGIYATPIANKHKPKPTAKSDIFGGLFDLALKAPPPSPR